MCVSSFQGFIPKMPGQALTVGPGLVDDPRSSKKCMALSQAKVSASNPLLGTSKGSESDGYPAPQNRGWHMWNQMKGQRTTRKYSTRNFTSPWISRNCFWMLRSEWFLYMFITDWSYLLSWMDDMLPAMDSSDPRVDLGFPTNSKTCKASSPWRCWRRMWLKTIQTWLFHHDSSSFQQSKIGFKQLEETFISSTLNSVPPLPAASWTWRFLQNVLTGNQAGQVWFPLQLYGNLEDGVSLVFGNKTHLWGSSIITTTLGIREVGKVSV